MAGPTIDQLQIEISGKASGATKSVRTLARNMENLGKSVGGIAPQLESISNSISKLQGVSGKTTISLRGAANSTKEYTNKVKSSSNVWRGFAGTMKDVVSRNNKAAKSFGTLASKFGMFYATFGPIANIATQLGAIPKSYMDYIESFNFFDVASNSIASQGDWKEAGAESAKAYAEGYKETLTNLNQKLSGFTQDFVTGEIDVSNMNNLGLDINALTGYEAELTSLGASLGVSTKNTQAMSKALTMLAGDMSSLHNIALDDVMTNFSSGIIGQSRALYKYGIDITNANLQQIAYEHGVTKSVSAMSQAEKVQLRLLGILEQSKDAWGDLANTIEQPANQMRKLSIGIKNVSMLLGKLFMPVVATILPYLNALVILIQRFLAWLIRLTGVKFDFSNIGSATSGIYDMDDALDDTSDSIDNATKKAKELNKQIRGWDKLNVINTSSGSGSSGSGSGSGGSFDLSDDIASALADYDRVWNEAFNNAEDKATELADRIEAKFKAHDYRGLGEDLGNAIKSGLEQIPWDDIYKVAQNFGSGFADFLNGLISPELFSEVAHTIAGAMNTALFVQNSFLKTFDFKNLGESIAAGINTYFKEKRLDLKGENIALWLSGVGETIGTALSEIDYGIVLNGLVKGLSGFITNLDGDAIVGLIGMGLLTKKGRSIAKIILSTMFGADGIWITSIKKILVNTAATKVEVAASEAVGDAVTEGVGKSIAAAGGGTLISKAGAAIEIALPITIAAIVAYEVLPDENGKANIDKQVEWLKEKIGDIRIDWGSIQGWDGKDIKLEIPFKEWWKLKREEFNEGKEKFFDDVEQFFSDLGNSFVTSVKNIFDFSWTIDWFNKAGDAFEQAWDSIGNGQFFDAGELILEGILDGFVGAFTFITEPISKFFIEIWNGICDVFGIHSPAKEMNPLGEYILKGILQGFENAFTFISEAVSGAIEWFEKGWDKVSDWFSTNVWDPIKTNVSEAFTTIKTNTSEAWNSIKDKTKTTFDDVKTKISDASSSAKEKVSSMKETISSKFSDLASTANDKWSNIRDHITNKLSDAAVKGKSKMEDLGNNIRNKWNNAKSWVASNLNFGSLKIEIPDLVSKLSNIISQISNRISNFTATFRIKLPHFSVGSKKSMFGFDYPTFEVSYYAKGGFPEMGSLMVAGEAGAEMVGNINGKTGVASNAEITGIRDSVESVGEEQNRLLAEQNRLLRQLLAKDTGINSDDLFATVQSKARAYTNRTGNPAFD